MPISNSSRALVATAAVALLAGCSGGSQLAPSAGAGSGLQSQAQKLQAIHQALGGAHNAFAGRQDIFSKINHGGGLNPSFHKVVNPDKGKKAKWKASVFVSDFEGGPSYLGEVYQIAPPSKKGTVIGEISDSINPQGMDFDSSGNLYVSATGSGAVHIYAPGNYTAASSLSDTGYYPVSTAVCPNGTVYASNIYSTSFGPGNIEIYAAGSTTPTGTVPDSNIYSGRFIACDSNNVLWFDYLDNSFYTAVASYDGSTVTEYGSLGIGFPGGVRVGNGGELGISDQYVGVEFFTPSDLSAGPYLTVGGFSDPVSFSLNKSQKDIWVADAGNAAAIEAKPNGKFTAEISGFVVPIDALVTPPGNT